VLHLRAHDIPIAVATGSRRRNFELKTGHLSEVVDCFQGRVVCGDDIKYGMKGKPSPDIFLVAAREMLGRDVGVSEEPSGEEEKKERAKGLVLEDGLPGVQAGKRAGMSGLYNEFVQCVFIYFKFHSGLGTRPESPQGWVQWRGKSGPSSHNP